MKKIIFAALAAASLLLVSCSATRPFAVTSNPVGSKVGEAKAVFILGGLNFDGNDLSIIKAARQSGITKISTVDMKAEIGFLALWTTVSTIITGE